MASPVAPVTAAKDNAGAELAEQKSVQDAMREHLHKQRRVRIRIPKEQGEQTVQINGYTVQIMAGVAVEVPEQIAEVLQDAGII